MAYRLRYQFWVDYVPAGVGLGIASGTTSGPGPAPAGNMQTLGFFMADGQVGNLPSPPNSATFTSTDITNMTNQAAADMAAQLTASQLRIQQFPSGGG